MKHNPAHSEHMEPRTRKPLFDINRVDYDWLKKTKNLKDLKAAYKELEIDGYFGELLKACGERIIELDPSFRRVVEG